MGRWRKSRSDNFYLANRPKPRKKRNSLKKETQQEKKENHIQKEEMNEINKNKYFNYLGSGNGIKTKGKS